MKRAILFLSISILFVLSGCKPSIESSNSKDLTFLNNEDITFHVTENILSDNSGVTVDSVYYMPEVDLLCFDISFINHSNDYTYEVSFNFDDEESKTQGSYTHHGLSVMEDGVSGMVCHTNVEYDSYEVKISLYFNNGSRITLAKITYEDYSYDEDNLYHFEIISKEQNTVEVLGDPFVSFDITSENDPRLIKGILKLRLYDGRNIVFENDINVDDFILDGDKWIIEDVSISGLVPDYRYTILLAYQPILDNSLTFLVGERTPDSQITSATMEEFDNNCKYSYLCAHVYNSEINDDIVTFDIYYYNDLSKINPDTLEPHKIYFKVFDDYHNEIFVTELSSNNVDVPLELLMGDHRIELESDILIIVDDFENDFYDEFYRDLDVRYVIDGVLFGD